MEVTVSPSTTGEVEFIDGSQQLCSLLQEVCVSISAAECCSLSKIDSDGTDSQSDLQSSFKFQSPLWLRSKRVMTHDALKVFLPPLGTYTTDCHKPREFARNYLAEKRHARR